MSLFNISSVYLKADGTSTLTGIVGETYFAISFSNINRLNDFINHHRQNERSIIAVHRSATATYHVLIEIVMSERPIMKTDFATYFTFSPQIVETINLDIGCNEFNYGEYIPSTLAWVIATGMVLAEL